MFELLTLALLLLILGLFIYWLLVKLIPKAALAIVGGVFILTLLGITFFNPNYRPTAMLWNVVATPLEPLGLAVLLLFFGARVVSKTAKKPAPSLVWSSLIILAIASNPFLTFQMARWVEQEAIAVEQRLRDLCQQDCPLLLTPPSQQTVAAIVLLAANTTEAPIPYRSPVQLTRRGNILIYGASLYDQQLGLGNTPRVIVCAGLRPELRGDESQINEIEDIRRALQRLGVPQTQIQPEQQGLDLRSHALQVRQLLNQLTNTNPEEVVVQEPIMLVTTGIESRRATQTFRRVGLRVVPRPTAFYTFDRDATPKRRWQPADFLPSVQALEITTTIVHEFWLSLYYFLRGWLFTIGV